MEAFEPKDFEYPIKKPSFDSVVRQKRREQAQKAEQEQYAVVNTEQKEDAPEPLYTEMEQKMMDEAANLSLVGHLSELRRRIIIMVVAIIIGTGIAYYYVDVLLDILLAPAGKLYYMRPTEAFFTYEGIHRRRHNFGIAYHTASNMALCETSIDSSRETSIKLDFTSSLFVVCNMYFLFLYLSVTCCG